MKDKKSNFREFKILEKKGGEYLELLPDSTEEVITVFTEDPQGNRAYERTLSFVLDVAADIVMPGFKLKIEYSISKGIFCTILGKDEVTEEEISLLKEKMAEIIENNYNIERFLMNKEEASEVFLSHGDKDTSELIEQCSHHEFAVYKLLGVYGYFFGPMGRRTGILSIFDLKKYKSGFVMLYPTLENPYELPEFAPMDKLYDIFTETGRWDFIIGVHDIPTINKRIRNGDTKEIIAVAEGLHEKKYVEIADRIADKKDIKVVLISGPSSSGKTTSSKRLAVQLVVNGLKPYPVEMDNYFLNRSDTPLLPDGSYDFESIRALDLIKFGEDMEKIISGERVRMPRYNFHTGMREEGEYLQIPHNGILIIEGIHALNPAVLSSMDRNLEYRIYVSALTQLNMDSLNRISTTDVRRLRRMVRDYRRRGYSAEETLTMFQGVIRGEKEFVYPYQEEADIMFNSTIVYEIPVLKKHALPLLKEIGEDSPVYPEARRLAEMLEYVDDMGDEFVPPNSVLREFIGGSFFD